MELIVPILFFAFLLAAFSLIWGPKKESNSESRTTSKPEDSFEEGIRLGDRFVEVYEKWSNNPVFRRRYEYYMLIGANDSPYQFVSMYLTDIVFTHLMLGYSVNITDSAAVPLFQVFQKLLFTDNDEKKNYAYLMSHTNIHEHFNTGMHQCEAAWPKYRKTNMIGVIEVLREIDKNEMGLFIELVKDYADWLFREADVDESKYIAWKEALQMMYLKEPEGIGSWMAICQEAKKRDVGAFSFDYDNEEDDLESDDYDEDEDEDLEDEDEDPEYEDEYEEEEEEEEEEYDFDITKDYYGKHGEFDRNDESRRVSEDIQSFHKTFPDAELTDHYYWDDVLDAETDGYLDD